VTRGRVVGVGVGEDGARTRGGGIDPRAERGRAETLGPGLEEWREWLDHAPFFIASHMPSATRLSAA
jgi:hypothetical protein